MSKKKQEAMKLYKSLDYEVKGVDEKKGIVEFYANSFGKTTGDADSDGDVIMQGAFKKTLQENYKRIRHLLNHDQSVGVPMEISEDNFGLLVKSKLILGKQVGRELYEEYKVYAEMGNSMEHSIGFITIKDERDRESNVNYIKEVKLMDVTTMETWGANQFTPQQTIKSFGSLEKAIEALEKLIKGRFEEGRLEQIEKSLQEMKALMALEPPAGTYSDDEPLVKLFKTTQKILENG